MNKSPADTPPPSSRKNSALRKPARSPSLVSDRSPLPAPPKIPLPQPPPATKRGSNNDNNSVVCNTSGDVRVIARIRPHNEKELGMGASGFCVTSPAAEVIHLEGTRTPENFSFDHVFTGESSQDDIFKQAALPVVKDLLDGYNGTIFAYGQTSSGKTHTMEGPEINDGQLKGVIPRTVEALFDMVAKADEGVEFVVKASYVEIYMEKIRDLLDQYHTKVNLQVREDVTGGIYIAGVTEEYVTSPDELLGVLAAGKVNRATAETGMNAGSSRSHSVFVITVEQRNLETNTVKTGMLYLVDLAGSEVVKKTQASGQTLEEAKTINKSLSTLGQVINALTDEKAQHVPYRDSKLTRVLQNSLGGNSKTVLIICLSPSVYNAEETASTLRFGKRAKLIKNKAVVNQARSATELSTLLNKAESTLTLQQQYILVLEAQLRSQGSNNTNTNADIARETSAQESSDVSEQNMPAVDEKFCELSKSFAALQERLAEEEAESHRSRREVEALNALLRESEHALTKANTDMSDLRRDTDALGSQLTEALSTAALLQHASEETSSKFSYQIEELQLTLETLNAENQKLADELREVTGDSVPRAHIGTHTEDPTSAPASPPDAHTPQKHQNVNSNPSSNPTSPPGDNTHVNINHVDVNINDMVIRASAEAAVCGDNGAVSSGLIALSNALNLSTPEELNEDAVLFVKTWTSCVTQSVKQAIKSVTAESRKEKANLEQELQHSTERLVTLEHMLEDKAKKEGETSTSGDAPPTSDQEGKSSLVERQLNATRGLQQRLEQLVAVHRQLLRRFAQLELENADYRKKLTLRDKHINRLDASRTDLVKTLTDQRERHVMEVAQIRADIAALRSSKTSEAIMPGTANGPSLERRVIRNGGPIKTVRGGGGRVSTGPTPEEDKGGGFLSFVSSYLRRAPEEKTSA